MPRILVLHGADADGCRRRLGAEQAGGPEVVPFSEAEGEAVLAGPDHLVLVYRSGPATLQADLGAGHPVAESLSRWKAEALRILGLKRRGRKRVMLIEETSLLHGGEEDVLEPLTRLIGAGRLAPPLPWPSASRSLLLLLAHRALEADPDIAALSTDLEVRSLPAPERGFPVAELEDMAREWHAQTEAQPDGDLLRRQVAELTAELSDRSALAERLHRDLAEARAGAAADPDRPAARDGTDEITAALEAQIGELVTERDLLLDQVSELRSESMTRYSQAMDLNERHSRLPGEMETSREAARRPETDLGRVSGEFARLRRSSAERIATLEADLARATAQQADYRSQMLQLTEKLEAAQVHWTGLLAESRDREASLRSGLEDLTQAYDRLMHSRSWKITEPLRAANRLLGRSRRGR